MMKKLAILIAPLVLGVCAASAQVNTVEHNVSLAFKFTYNATEFLQREGSFLVMANKSVTLKNADFIKLYNDENTGDDFPLNSKIIRQNFFNTNGSSAGPAKFVIRDKAGNEADITSTIGVTMNGATAKVKYVEATKVGSHSYLLSENFEYNSKPGAPSLGAIEAYSLTANNFKSVYVKKTTEVVETSNISMKMTGAARFTAASPLVGVIQGTLKISGPKIIPAPPAPPAVP